MTKETKVGLVIGLLFMVGVVYLLNWVAQPSKQEELADEYKAREMEEPPKLQLGKPMPLSVTIRTPELTKNPDPVTKVTVPVVGVPSNPALGTEKEPERTLPLPVINKEPEKRFYVVKPGQTLSDVAEAVYGAGHREEWRRIHKANEYKVPDPHAIRPDMKLLIPPLEQAETATKSPLFTGLDSGTYKVLPGDTLSEIASRKLGSSLRAREIYELNRNQLPDMDTLQVGMVLKLPAASKTSTLRLPKAASDIRW